MRQSHDELIMIMLRRCDLDNEMMSGLQQNHVVMRS